MDFRDTPEEAKFREEVRSFIREHAPQGRWGGIGSASDEPEARAFLNKLAERKWTAPAWPKEYGGAGMSVIEQFIFNSEIAEARAPSPFSIAVGMSGPTLIVEGTEEQKKRYLPKILSGEEVWCQGYSEPGSGSDLASLQTRAVRDGDEYVLNGQKIWTSGAHQAKWIMMLARTDPDAPKHRGISYFIVDMHAPGVTVRPLVNAAMSHEFNEVFFEDVRVPKENLIGEENRGWYVAQTTLSFERSNIAGAVGARQAVEDIIEFARDRGKDSMSTLGRNPALRHELASRYLESQVATLLSYKIVSIQAKEGIAPGDEAAIAKMYNTELNQRVFQTGMRVAGLYGQLEGEGAPMKGFIKHMYLRSIANTIEGGTSEISRNVIATRGLGLLRG